MTPQLDDGHRNRAPVTDQERSARRQGDWAGGAVVCLFMACLAASPLLAWRVTWPYRPDPRKLAGIPQRLDPNTAQWFELAQLPGIGETLGRRIVQLRDQRRQSRMDGQAVFRRPADLGAVRGIGTKTIQRLGRFLVFRDSLDGRLTTSTMADTVSD